MSKYPSIIDIYLYRLNNAECTYFLSEVIRLIILAQIKSLGLPEEFLPAFQENVRKLNEILNASHSSEQTAILQDLDAQRDKLIVYFFGEIRMKGKSPIPTESAAADSLALIIKSYGRLYDVPVNQKTQDIFSLEAHLSNEEEAVHIARLGLKATATALFATNKEYQKHSQARRTEHIEKDLGSCADIRLLTDSQYAQLVTLAQAFSIAIPTPEATNFVEELNKLIKETNTAYNQRMGQLHSHPDEEEVTEEGTEKIITEEVSE